MAAGSRLLCNGVCNIRLLGILRFLMGHPLGRGLRPVWKFVRWQISMRMTPQKIVFPWIDDARLIAGRGETGITGNYYVGLMEFDDMGFLLHYLSEEMTFVDVGANAGVYTVLAAKVKRCPSIAFEPIAGTFARLLDQIRLNAIQDRVHAVRKGVGARPGTLRFTTDRDTVNRVTDLDTANTSVIDVTTLDAELPEDGHYVLKIDVEGFEMPVLEGAAQVLASSAVSAIVIELNGSGQAYGVSDADIHRHLLNLGFASVRYDPLTRTLTPADRPSERGNTIYLRDVEAARQRVGAEPRHRIVSAFGREI